MDNFTDYYAVLGVDSRASTDTIKIAFKKLALQYHPDVYKGEDAEERMRLLLLAYQTLSDPDARRSYDRQRAEHLGFTPVGAARTYASGTSNGGTSTKQAAGGQPVAFPKLDEADPVEFRLEGFTYKLWPDDALLLRQGGMLRGEARDAQQGRYYCHRCHHRWTASSQGKQPATCPACRAGDWAEYLLLRCVHCHAVFESQEIRDKLRGGQFYFPYELFPLCPHCRRPQWCPAEDARVNALRASAARQRALLLLATVVVTLLVVSVLLFVLAR